MKDTNEVTGIVQVPVDSIEPKEHDERQAWLKAWRYWSQHHKRWIVIGHSVVSDSEDYSAMLARLDSNPRIATMRLLDLCYWCSVAGALHIMRDQVKTMTANTVADVERRALWYGIMNRAYSHAIAICGWYMEEHRRYREMPGYEPLSLKEDVWREQHYELCVKMGTPMPYYTKSIDRKTSDCLRRIMEAWAKGEQTA